MDDSRETSSSASADEPFADTALAGGLEQLLYELARAPAREPKLGPGSILGRFAVHEAIGRGAFGIVYAALDTELGRDVAVKLMRTRGDAHDDASRALGSLFKREAEMAARLNHPNIVTLHDHGTVDGWPYLILELLRGETLESRIDHGPLTVEEAVPLMIQVAHGLRYAHRMGVVHRDLKPSNLFLTSDGQMKILDFGLARLQAAVGTAEVSEKVARSPAPVTRRARRPTWRRSSGAANRRTSAPTCTPPGSSCTRCSPDSDHGRRRSRACRRWRPSRPRGCAEYPMRWPIRWRARSSRSATTACRRRPSSSTACMR